MKVNLKFDYSKMSEKIIHERLDDFGLKYNYIGNGEVDFLEKITYEKIEELSLIFELYGIEIIENQKSVFVQKVKDAIREMVHQEEPAQIKSSVFLADKLNYSYGYIANIFSDITFTSVENYIILQKIELAKHLMLTNTLTLTEVAYRLNYSSVAHLSTQFKNTTGITPSTFLRIINKRKTLLNNND